MLYYALMFLVVGVIAGALNMAGVAAVAVQISWILFLIGIVLLVIHLLTNRSVRASCTQQIHLNQRVDRLSTVVAVQGDSDATRQTRTVATEAVHAR